MYAKAKGKGINAKLRNVTNGKETKLVIYEKNTIQKMSFIMIKVMQMMKNVMVIKIIKTDAKITIPHTTMLAHARTTIHTKMLTHANMTIHHTRMQAHARMMIHHTRMQAHARKEVLYAVMT